MRNKSILKLVSRFVMIIVCSLLVLFVLNICLFIGVSFQGVASGGGWQVTEELTAELQENGDGTYFVSERGKQILAERDAWAVLVQDGTGDVVWYSENLPAEIPLHYTAAQISADTLGYIEDYPTTTAARENDLLIMGHPKETYWKSMWNTYDLSLIKNLPRNAVMIFLVNLLVVFLIYAFSTSGIVRYIRPLIRGIEALPEERVYVREKGLFTDLAHSVNEASEKLKIQEQELKKKERARANWISGVSHDIRTPLSMVMGYAAQMEDDAELPDEARKRAQMIRLQSVKMKNLVNDLNLASKLEYQMQPLHMERISLAAVVRQTVAEFANLDFEEKYPICFEAKEGSGRGMIRGDKDLLCRAIGNILTNSQVHNPDGCGIMVETDAGDGAFVIRLEDDGIGIGEEELQKLQSTPHYMMSDGGVEEPRHGLGLLIVRQIVAAHGGTVLLDHGRQEEKGGFAVEMHFPIKENDDET
ncbi:sensor histidine kinase [Mediterraneibacter glycyrrhizinilyticus]|uniref:sensor histidine kinase n=1 Tax=Mediterraneibacter glycyrrhizinilyticus TaxID=342942 RepID=UPI0018A0FBF5|nr:HAMP domain-containing sensor histidine kinase [Mediterraneibacter glycyrrhizinilyticus]